MPFFNCTCQSCGNKFEYFERNAANPKKPVCTQEGCGSEDVEKDIGKPNAIYKGTGFYTNDYGNKSNPIEKAKYLAGD